MEKETGVTSGGLEKDKETSLSFRGWEEAEILQIHDSGFIHMGLSGGSAVRNLPIMPEMQETWVQSLVHEDPLEEELATHSRILAWRIPWAEEPGGLQSVGSQRTGHD